jgi:hypothetical protein
MAALLVVFPDTQCAPETVRFADLRLGELVDLVGFQALDVRLVAACFEVFE